MIEIIVLNTLFVIWFIDLADMKINSLLSIREF